MRAVNFSFLTYLGKKQFNCPQGHSLVCRGAHGCIFQKLMSSPPHILLRCNLCTWTADLIHLIYCDCWDLNYQFSSLQSLSCVQLFVTPWTAAHQASLSITNSGSLLKLMSIESVILSNHLILCHLLLLLPLIFPRIRVSTKILFCFYGQNIFLFHLSFF